jgi:hypothetical protein
MSRSPPATGTPPPIPPSTKKNAPPSAQKPEPRPVVLVYPRAAPHRPHGRVRTAPAIALGVRMKLIGAQVYTDQWPHRRSRLRSTMLLRHSVDLASADNIRRHYTAPSVRSNRHRWHGPGLVPPLLELLRQRLRRPSHQNLRDEVWRVQREYLRD